MGAEDRGEAVVGGGWHSVQEVLRRMELAARAAWVAFSQLGKAGARNVGEALTRLEASGGCLACGACCRFFGGNLRASSADRERWRKENRDDLLRMVNRLGWIWTDPATGRLIDPCPFLQADKEGKVTCAIHSVKPDMCRAYPTLAHEKRCVRGRVFH